MQEGDEYRENSMKKNPHAMEITNLSGNKHAIPYETERDVCNRAAS
jgi:hypothetical protein